MDCLYLHRSEMPRLNAELEAMPTAAPIDPKSSEEEKSAHERAGHVPAKSWCPACIKAGGRQKPHFRQSLPCTGGVLSVDLMGPYAQAFSPQHMERPVVRYAVVGAFLPPTRLQLSEQSHLENPAKQEGLSSPLRQAPQEESIILPPEYKEPAAGESREDPSATGPNSLLR